jgi:hypothetical protein
MFKITITRTTKTATETTTTSKSLFVRAGHALRSAPTHHRIVTFVLFSAVWAVLYFYMHAESAAKSVEVFGIAPFADRAIKAIFGEAD